MLGLSLRSPLLDPTAMMGFLTFIYVMEVIPHRHVYTAHGPNLGMMLPTVDGFPHLSFRDGDNPPQTRLQANNLLK